MTAEPTPPEEPGPPADDASAEAAADRAKRRLRDRLRNLSARVWTALVLGPLLIASLYLGPKLIFELVAMVAIALAAIELMSMILPAHPVGRVWGTLASVAVGALVLHPFPGAPVVGLVGLVIPAVLVTIREAKPIESAALRFGWLVAGPIYVGGLLATLVLLHRLPWGGSWVLLSLLLAWFGDTGAYFAGWRFGRTKLAPDISPAKTVEGSIGGLAGSVLGAVLASVWYLPPLPLGEGIALALVAGTLGQVGDLGESLLKRATGVKDSGAVLPGHGGLLDRVDALMFTSAVVWLYTQFAS